ncbi:hypothetical protein SAMN02799622_05275 [Methylobacterium sp. UNC378MF]|uniref:SH3 domain-containing protein n=1 Tax=Methylobacterium sp. UNC378MF TaxID=1502748 RepID=UPI00088FCFE1|nr:SH3 domain-containing protein [Methylobacterium sp. UNC378MF]SDA32567.1 hypothetical protein SAMN02799622_05275 [Methylobacterium sp. UNC378MF]
MQESKRRQAGIIILPLVVSSALAAGSALATSDGPDRFAVRDVRPNDTLALRAQPNASARKITGLPPQTRGLQNLGCVNGKTGRETADTAPAGGPLWCKVRIGSLLGWASSRFLREDTEVLKPYSVSGAPTGPGQFVATSSAIDKTAAGEGRWKIVAQTVISESTTGDQPNEVIVTSQLVDCQRGRSEVIRLDGITPGSSGSIEDAPGPDYHPALAGFDEENLWWFACRGAHRRYLWP